MLDKPVLVDTGALIALYNTNDPYHAACALQVQSLPLGKAYTCWPVVTEAFYLLRKYPRDQQRLLDALDADEFVLLTLDRNDLQGIRDIFNKYHDQDIDLADAALVRLANREGIDVVFTIDRRHFEVYRKQNGRSFHLVPEPQNI